MRILSWNVNGCRARLKAGLEDVLQQIQPDIFCMQETRAKPEQLPKSFLNIFDSYFSLHNKPGYAGSSVHINKQLNLKPLHFQNDFPENDEPGRVSICDFKYFKLINAYVPNAGQRLEKLDHRVDWQNKLTAYIKQQMKPIIYCGDLNVAHKQIDVGSSNVKAGTSYAERTAHQEILNEGLVDAWRHLNPNKIEYTWFSNQYNSRAVNRGMRIDSFIMSEELLPQITKIEIIQDADLVIGSDHSPVLLEINLEV
jgi:exodeoxyribonuclease-3